MTIDSINSLVTYWNPEKFGIPRKAVTFSPDFIEKTRKMYFAYFLLSLSIISLPCKKCDRDFLMSFWRQFGLARKWHQIRWKFHHFLSKFHGNSMTWPCPKSMSCFYMENKWNLYKWHGMVMQFGVNFDQTATKSSCDVKWRGIKWESSSHFLQGVF